MGFGKLLNQKLKERNLSQAELADAVGIPRTTLNGIIKNDTSRIEIETFLKMCEYLQSDPEEFTQEFIAEKQKNKLPYRQRKFIEMFQKLTIRQQERLMDVAEPFLSFSERQQDKILGMIELYVSENQEASEQENA